MTSPRSRLKASLLAIVAPMLACGGATTDDTGPAGTAGAGGGSAGSAAAGKAGSTSGGSAGATAGSAGTTTGGSAGTTTGGSAGATGGSAGKATGGSAGATGGSAGKSTGGSAGATGGSAGKSTGGSAGATGGSAGKATGGTAGGTAGVGGAAGTGGGAGATGGSGGGFAYLCANPVAIVVAGKDTGYDTCGAGQLRRREKLDCPTTVPRAEACVSSVPSADTCMQDSDCTAQPNGYCSASFGFGPGGCACQYGCLTDADCGSGNICVCGDPIGTCRPASCSSAADCAFGDCTSYDTSKGCDFLTFSCQTAGDTCGGDLDCQTSSVGSYCSYAVDPSGMQAESRSCVPGGCAIGRPLFVDEAVRTASLARRTDWAA